MVFARDALSRAMREIARDPERHRRADELLRERARPGAVAPGRSCATSGPTRGPLFAFQTFDYLRAFFNNRIAVVADELHALRGRRVPGLAARPRSRSSAAGRATSRARTSSSRSACTRSCASASAAYRIACLPDCVGVTEGPDSVRKLVSQRERWQRVILETVLGEPPHVVQPALRDRRARSACRSTSSRRSSRPSFEVLAIATLVVGGAAGPDRLVGVRPRSRCDHVREQRAHDRCAADARPRGAGLPACAASSGSSR